MRMGKIKAVVGALLAVGTRYLAHDALGDGGMLIATVERRVGDERLLKNQLYECPWYRLKK